MTLGAYCQESRIKWTYWNIQQDQTKALEVLPMSVRSREVALTWTLALAVPLLPGCQVRYSELIPKVLPEEAPTPDPDPDPLPITTPLPDLPYQRPLTDTPSITLPDWTPPDLPDPPARDIQPGELVLAEVLSNCPGNDNYQLGHSAGSDPTGDFFPAGEYFRVEVRGERSLDLRGYRLCESTGGGCVDLTSWHEGEGLPVLSPGSSVTFCAGNEVLIPTPPRPSRCSVFYPRLGGSDQGIAILNTGEWLDLVDPAGAVVESHWTGDASEGIAFYGEGCDPGVGAYEMWDGGAGIVIGTPGRSTCGPAEE